MNIGSAVMFGSAAAVLASGTVHLPKRTFRFSLRERRRQLLRDAVGSVVGTDEALHAVFRLQMVAVAATTLIAVVLVLANPTALGVVAALLLIAGAWQVPLVVARSREQHRREQFDIELSDALGEMVMGVEAGLTLEGVMNVYAQRRATALAAEFAYVLDRINLGATRIAALEEFSERTPTPGVRSFVSAVQQNQKLGTPLAAVLRQQGETTRRKRRQAVEEHASKLSLKMIFPTVFCILPVLLIVIVGPSIIRLIETFPK